MPNSYLVLAIDFFWRDSIFTKPRTNRRRYHVFPANLVCGRSLLFKWENLVLVVVLVLQSKALYWGGCGFIGGLLITVELITIGLFDTIDIVVWCQQYFCSFLVLFCLASPVSSSSIYERLRLMLSFVTSNTWHAYTAMSLYIEKYELCIIITEKQSSWLSKILLHDHYLGVIVDVESFQSHFAMYCL